MMDAASSARAYLAHGAAMNLTVMAEVMTNKGRVVAIYFVLPYFDLQWQQPLLYQER